MIKYTVSEDQSLFDIALQAYGDVAGYRQLILDNPELNGADVDLLSGQVLLVDESKVLKPELVAIFSGINYRINTGQPVIPVTAQPCAPSGGIVDDINNTFDFALASTNCQTTPANAPTNGVVDDLNDTFDFTLATF